MTTSRRVLKAAQAIREVVSMTILTELRDPRVRDVTVTFVEVAPDMRQAKVHVSIMGDENKQKLGLRGLQNSAGFFQHKIADRIDMRYTPVIQFVLDKGVKHSILVAQMLNDLLPKKESEALVAVDQEETAEDFENEEDVEEEDVEEDDEKSDIEAADKHTQDKADN